VAHSTVRFWDLRYFQHQDEHTAKSEADHPSPHIIVVNGSEAKLLLQENHWLSDKQIVIAEALRYGYLSSLTSTGTRGKSDLPHLVVLGDFLPSANTFLLTKLHESQTFATTKFRMSLRSHPICKFDSNETRSFNESITDVDLKTLLGSADVVLTTANSSSAAESVSLGIPTILMVDPESLNYSPFRKTQLAQFVTTAEELSSALNGFNDHVSSQIPDFFCLDDHYPRWRKLLSID
jgi:surface carbohydrate biosynthesis protein (TIGR04326 family)